MGREIGGTESAQVGVNFENDRTKVQSLFEQGVSEIPLNYVRNENERCTLQESFGRGIPVIDLSTDATQVAEEIGRACSEWGFFQVVHHGVPLELLERMLQLTSEFYKKPVEEKLKYARTPAKDGKPPSDGYGSLYFNGPATLDWKDYFVHYCVPRSRYNPERWPAEPEDYRSTVLKYSDETLKLAQRLLGIISDSLGLETKYIEEALGEPSQNIVMNYYSPCPQPELALGITAHSDNGAITILMQNDVAGLQVLNNGEWFTVEPVKDALVVNLGDMLQLLTNDRYKSVMHRGVVNKDKPRQSVATFYNVSQDRVINPAPGCIDADHPRLFKEVVFGDHLKVFYSKGHKDGDRWMDKYRLAPQ